MKIALIGYGRMGHIIEEVAKQRGHEVVCTIDVGEEAKYESSSFKDADVAIEFSVPTAAVENYSRCFKAGVPVVSGTTGWLKDYTVVEELCKELGSRFIYGSNFSVGVNIFWAANKYLARLMEDFGAYKAQVHEVHHTAKLDHPSGTAITTADQIISSESRYKKWVDCMHGELEAMADELPVTWDRREGVPGIHEVKWRSAEDEISLRHEAFSRKGFAVGAVMAAEWIVKQEPGFYSISDMFSF